jgi:hypothetical protein
VLCERYLIVIPGLAHPPDLFPGMEVTASPLDESVASYAVSGAEVLQALGVVGVVGLLFLLALKYMAILPTEARRVSVPAYESAAAGSAPETRSPEPAARMGFLSPTPPRRAREAGRPRGG